MLTLNDISTIRMYRHQSGLCNQLFILVNGILASEGKKILLIDRLLNDYQKYDTTDISNILNLDVTTMNIKKINENYPVLVDINQCDFKIQKVEYGIPGKMNNVTDLFSSHIAVIKKSEWLNVLFGDPAQNQFKFVAITFSINDIWFTHSFPEYYGHLNQNICICKENFLETILQYDAYYQYNIVKFNEIFKSLHFSNIMLEKCNDIQNAFNYPILNVVHLRIEDDALRHWSRISGIEYIEYKKIIIEAYQTVIYEHIPIGSAIYLATGLESPYEGYELFFQQLQKDYHIQSYKKDFTKGREICALIDYLIAIQCKQIYIGSHTLTTGGGSTFSYAISLKLEPNVKQVLVNLEKPC